MTRWLLSLLWCAATVSVLLQTQVQSARSATDPSELIPIFRGISDTNSQPPVAAKPTGTGNGQALNPLEFSPDTQRDDRVPGTAPSTPSAGSTVSTDPTATNMTASAIPGGGPVIHHCSDELSQMSVENVPGVFCVKGPRICSGSLGDGNCPGVQDGLPLGSHCGKVYTGAYGCQPGPKPK